MDGFILPDQAAAHIRTAARTRRIAALHTDMKRDQLRATLKTVSIQFFNYIWKVFLMERTKMLHVIRSLCPTLTVISKNILVTAINKTS